MPRISISMTFATLFLTLAVRSGSAQVTMAPKSPRWGETITITADPVGTTDTERFYKSDQLYASIYEYRQGILLLHQRLWTPMAWDGQRFVGRITLPAGCEGGWVEVATAERRFLTARPKFVCRTSDGTLPPGALITGLLVGARDKTNWKSDIAQDLEQLRHVAGHGWEHGMAWQFRWQEERTPAEGRLRQVERVEHDAGQQATPALLGSLVFGYLKAEAPRQAFDKLKELCDQYPESDYTVSVGLHWAFQAIFTSPELTEEFNNLLVRVASAHPVSKGLRPLLRQLALLAPRIPLITLRTIAGGWIAEDPTNARPHYYLAAALEQIGGHAAEAETSVSRAIDLSFQPHPFDSADAVQRQMAFRLRSKLRAERGDLPGAIADTWMTQRVIDGKPQAEDLATEAELWRRLGYSEKSERVALEAYRLGALKAEAVLKEAYVRRTGRGDDEGFAEYLAERLRGSDKTSGPSLRTIPAFTVTTLEGIKIDPATLRGKITVLDFWLISCVFCRLQQPKLNELVAEVGNRVRFLSFSLDKTDALRTYLAAHPFKYEIVPDSEAIARSFDVHQYPTHMIIDRTGKIVWVSGIDFWQAVSEADRIERLRVAVKRVLAQNSGKSR